jgi:hypothetical protein
LVGAAQIAVTLFADAAEPVLAAAGVLLRHEAYFAELNAQVEGIKPSAVGAPGWTPA